MWATPDSDPAHKLRRLSERGPVAPIQESSKSTHLEISKSSTPIYQAYSLNTNKSVIHKLIFDTDQQVPVSSEPEQYCRESLMIHQELLKPIDLESLELNNTAKINNSQIAVSFSRLIDGESIKNAFIDCILSSVEGGLKLGKIINNGFFEKNLFDGHAMTQENLEYIFDGQVDKLELSKQIWIADHSGVYRASIVEGEIDGQTHRFTVANNSGKLLEVATGEIPVKSKVKGRVFERSYLDGETVSQVLPLTPIISGADESWSSLDGFYDSSTNIERIRLDSERVVIYNDSQTEAMELGQYQLAPGHVEFRDTESDQAGLNSFVAIHRINKFVRRYLSPLQVSYLDKKVKVYVNQEGECNAFYTTTRAVITLFRAGGGCANVATINDVVYHEWGHGLDDHTGRNPGVTDRAFSEGIADVVSAYFTEDPRIGIGFVQDREFGIRTISSARRYPEDVGSPHVEGGIIAGAFWD